MGRVIESTRRRSIEDCSEIGARSGCESGRIQVVFRWIISSKTRLMLEFSEAFPEHFKHGVLVLVYASFQ
jgi:hypothetical protein